MLHLRMAQPPGLQLIHDRIVEYTEFGDTALVETVLFGKELVDGAPTVEEAS